MMETVSDETIDVYAKQQGIYKGMNGMDVHSLYVKKAATDLGADLCGVAAVDRFRDAPKGYNPCDVLPECRSVIVVAARFLNSTLSVKSTLPYTVVRNQLSAGMDRLSLELSELLESQGAIAVPIGANEPCVLDVKNKKLRGVISLKHAAVFAGLGKMGKNTLLINDRYGNMLWLGAVLTSAELEADPVATYEGCIEGCRLCLDACPVKALDGISINQRACGGYAFGDEKVLFRHYGGWRIKCNRCRTVCPNCLGIKQQVIADE